MTSPTSQAVTPTKDPFGLNARADAALRKEGVEPYSDYLKRLAHGQPPYTDEQVETIQWLANRELARRASMKEPK